MTRQLKTSGQKRSIQMREMGRSIVESLAADMDRLTVTITDHVACGQKGKIKVGVIANSDVQRSDILQAINGQLGGKMRAVARSFKIAESSQNDRNNVRFDLVGYVVPNVEIIATASDKGKSMKCVASNMFMDASDCIWSKTGDFLYKKSDIETAEELNKFLTECSSSAVRQRKTCDFDIVEAAAGDFISYQSRGEMCFGFVVAADANNAKLMVIAEGEEDPEVIDNFDVQEVAPIDEAQVNFPEEGEMVETSASSIDLNGIVAYYKRWLQMNPSYANQLISRLKAHMFV